MPEELTWDDAEEIAQILRERFPETDPETVSDLELARWVKEIPMLRDQVVAQDLPGSLEAIRSAWRDNL